MERRYLCLWLPRLSIDRLRLEGRIGDGPAATVRQVSNTAYLDAVGRMAEAVGVRPGMTLASARAICPGLQTVEAAPGEDRAFLERVALWADRFSPLVALDGSDGVMLDVAGCAHLFGGERELLHAARGGLLDQGLEASAALAGASGAAAALARYGGRPEILIDPSTSLAEALKPLPAAALCAVSADIEADVLSGMARVGLRRIGDLLPLPRASLAARFGLVLAGALDKVLGRAPRPIDSRPPLPPYRVRLRFPDPIGDPDDIAAALHRLLDRLCARLEAEGRGGRRFDWLVVRADGVDQRLSIGTARPARDSARLARLFEEKLQTVAPGDGIDSMMLSAPLVEDFDLSQDGFATGDAAAPMGKPRVGIGAGAGLSDPDRALTTVIDRLANRLGDGNLFRLVPVDSHLPDRSQEAGPATPKRRETPPVWPSTAPRPVRLLNHPYPIDPLTAARGHDAPTAFRIFGRRTPMRVLIGPERITPEWWRADARWRAGARDYFDVEDETGRRFWIYRDAAAGPSEERRWYLHGLF